MEDFNNIKVSRTCDGKMHEWKCKDMFSVLNMSVPFDKKKKKNNFLHNYTIIYLVSIILISIIRPLFFFDDSSEQRIRSKGAH